MCSSILPNSVASSRIPYTLSVSSPWVESQSSLQQINNRSSCSHFMLDGRVLVTYDVCKYGRSPLGQGTSTQAAKG